MAELLHNYVITYIRNYVITKFILRNLSRQSIRTSMQNLESVAQKMAELLHNYVITYIRNYVITKFILRNLSGQSIRTSMQNLESVAQKMAELWHLVRKRTDIHLSISYLLPH